MNPITEFEEAFKQYTGSTYSIAVNNGTSALIAAINSLDLLPKSNIITTPYTFPATANAIILSGHKPVFVDITETYQINPEKIEEAFEDINIESILAVHLFGKPCKIKKIVSYGLPVIEDCSQALGLRIKGQHVGTFGDAGTFSFYASKNLSTFEGGMVITSRKEIDDQVRFFINHGFVGDEMLGLGYNFKMPWICAFLGEQTLKLHKKGIEAELGQYNATDGYYSKLVYQHKWYKEHPKLWKTYPCPIAEKLASQVRKREVN